MSIAFLLYFFVLFSGEGKKGKREKLVDEAQLLMLYFYQLSEKGSTKN